MNSDDSDDPDFLYKFKSAMFVEDDTGSLLLILFLILKSEVS